MDKIQGPCSQPFISFITYNIKIEIVYKSYQNTKLEALVEANIMVKLKERGSTGTLIRDSRITLA